MYDVHFNNEQKKGLFKQTNNGITYVKYMNKKTLIFKNVKNGYKDKNSDSYNIETKKIVHSFDNEGIQLFRYEEKEVENYYLDKKSGVKTLHEPDCMENYLNRDYYWRLSDGMILHRKIIKYVYPEDSASFIPLHNYDGYLIGKNMKPNCKKLPTGGTYTWLDSELYENYKKGNCDVIDLWDNRGDNYQKIK